MKIIYKLAFYVLKKEGDNKVKSYVSSCTCLSLQDVNKTLKREMITTGFVEIEQTEITKEIFETLYK